MLQYIFTHLHRFSVSLLKATVHQMKELAAN